MMYCCNSITATRKKRVVVLGGGFAGTFVAASLQEDFEVILVDRKKYFFNVCAEHRILVEPSFMADNIEEHNQHLTQTRIVVDSVQSISDSEVITGDSAIPYDYLVIATGCRQRTSGVQQPGPKAFCLGYDAGKIAEQSAALRQARRITIAGGGPVGVEVCAEISEAFPQKEVTLLFSGPRLLPRLPEEASRVAASHLMARHNVTLVPNVRVESVDGETGCVTTTDHHQSMIGPSDLVIVCTGFAPNSEFLRGSFMEASLNKDGYLRTDAHLRVPIDSAGPSIFALGDIIESEEEKSVRATRAQARVVVNNIKALEANQKLEDHSPKRSGQTIMLGRTNAISIGADAGISFGSEIARRKEAFTLSVRFLCRLGGRPSRRFGARQQRGRPSGGRFQQRRQQREDQDREERTWLKIVECFTFN